MRISHQGTFLKIGVLLSLAPTLRGRLDLGSDGGLSFQGSIAAVYCYFYFLNLQEYVYIEYIVYLVLNAFPSGSGHPG